MKKQTFFLSLPPSTNNLFINVRGKGRIKSPEYRAWITEMGWRLKLQRARPMVGDIFVRISAKRPSRKRDIDNAIKAILDLISAHEVIRDDRDVIMVTARWISKSHLDFHGEPADVMLRVWAMERQ